MTLVPRLLVVHVPPPFVFPGTPFLNEILKPATREIGVPGDYRSSRPGWLRRSIDLEICWAQFIKTG